MRSRPLLFHTAASVSAIARAVGFSSANYYVRCFRAMFGCTPGQYRRLRNGPPAAAAIGEHSA